MSNKKEALLAGILAATMAEQEKEALLAGILAATMAEQERKDFFEFTNTYAGLDGLTYIGSGKKSYSKSPLTKKQKKARAASKRAKQARKRGR